jgi:hypothetical protein
MKSLILALAMPLLLSACADYPRDLEGTSEAIHSRKTMRIGIVAGPTSNAARRQAFIAELARRTGARPLYVTGSAEPLCLIWTAESWTWLSAGLLRKRPGSTRSLSLSPSLPAW